MPFKHFTLPVPAEMQFYDGSLWELPEDHVSVDSQEGYQLGYVSTSWDEPGRSSGEIPVTPPSCSPPHEAPRLTPLIIHSSTWKLNSPLASSTVPAQRVNAVPNFGPTRSSSNPESLESFHTDRWINSQSTSGTEHGRRYGAKLHASSRTPCLENPHFGSSFDPDSADTSYSTLPPQTPPPPSFHDAHPSRLSARPPAIASPSPPSRTYERRDSGAIDQAGRVASTETLDVEIEARTPDDLPTQMKKNRWTSLPSYASTPDNVVHGPLNSTPNAYSLDSYGLSNFEEPLAPLSALVIPAHGAGAQLNESDPLDVLALAATMQLSVGELDPKGSGMGWQDLRCTQQEQEMRNRGNTVDDKRWILEQINPASFRPKPAYPYRPQSLAGRTHSQMSDIPSLPVPSIPSSGMPRPKYISPARSTSSSDMTAESDLTPRIDSRTRRAKERAARMSAKAVKEAREKEIGDEEEFTPGPRGRARSLARSLKQRFIDGEILDPEMIPEEVLPTPQPLVFGSRAWREDTAEDDPVDEPASMSIAFKRLDSIAEEPILRSISVDPAGPFASTYARGKTFGKPAAVVPPSTGSLSRFIAPRPIKRDTPSLPDPTPPEATTIAAASVSSKKRKLSDENDDAAKGDDTRGPPVPEKKAKMNDPTVPPIIAKHRIPLELLRQPVKFTSISEAAKLRRAAQAAATLQQASANTASASTSSIPSVPSKPKGATAHKATPASEKKTIVAPLRVHNTRAASVSPHYAIKSYAGARRTKKDESESEVEEEEEDDNDEEEEEEDVEDVEEEKKTSKNRKKAKTRAKDKSHKRGKDRIYADEEKEIMLRAWDGIQPLTKERLRECAATILSSGHGIRTPEALKWYMKNTLWPRYAERYGRPKVRDLSGWRTASDSSGASTHRK